MSKEGLGVTLSLETWRDILMQLTLFRDMLRGAGQSPAAFDQVTRSVDALRADPELWRRLVEAGLVKEKTGGN